MAGTIVVGIDASDEAKQALRWAVAEARLRDASVVAVHAWQLPPPAIAPDDVVAAAPPLDYGTLTGELAAAAKDVAQRVVSEVPAEGVEVQAIAEEGPAGDVLVEAARNAELLVVGSRGHGGLVGALLGSVSGHVAHHAPCPVVIHR